MPNRCTCYIVGRHKEKPRLQTLAQRIVRLPGRRPFYLPPVETQDHRCPIHGVKGEKIKRAIGATWRI